MLGLWFGGKGEELAELSQIHCIAWTEGLWRDGNDSAYAAFCGDSAFKRWANLLPPL